jgi:hypothetical protein
MAKTKRYNNFREFYEDEERPPKKMIKEKNRNLNQYKYMDPKDLEEDDFDDEYESER